MLDCRNGGRVCPARISESQPAHVYYKRVILVAHHTNSTHWSTAFDCAHTFVLACKRSETLFFLK